MKYLNSWMLFETRNQNDIKKFNRKDRLTVVHRTEDANLSLIGRDGFRSGRGNAWGDGIYTCYDLISTTKKNPYNDGHERVGTYGPTIIENEVLSLKDFIIFDYDVAKQYYGKDYSIKTQIKNIVPNEVYELRLPQIEEAHNICLAHRDLPLKNLYTTDAVRIIYKINEIMDHVRGIVFTGAFDGKVLISYDRENLVPIKYSNNDGKTWDKIKDKGAYKIAKENFFKLIKSGSDIDNIVSKVKDRINNTITTKFGPDKNLDNLDYSEILSVKNEFDYIFKVSTNLDLMLIINRVDISKESDEYKLYKKSLETIRNEFKELFEREFSEFKDSITKIDWSESITNIIYNLIYDFHILQTDTTSDESKEFLKNLKEKVLGIYSKELLIKLSEISKDDDFFNKFLKLFENYRYLPSTDSSSIVNQTGIYYSNIFSKDGVIGFIKSFNGSEKIISDILSNLEKKIKKFLSNNDKNIGDIVRGALYEIRYNTIDEIYMEKNIVDLINAYKYSTSIARITNGGFKYTQNQIKEDKWWDDDSSEYKNFKELSETLLISYDNFCESMSEYFVILNKSADKVINNYIDKESLGDSNREDTLSDFAGDIMRGYTGGKSNDEHSNFIFVISAIKDNTVLNKLTDDGFLTKRTSNLLKLMFLLPAFEKVEVGKSFSSEELGDFESIELLDFQEERALNLYVKEYNNPEYIGLFRMIFSNKKNYELFNKLKSEGKDVSNWILWISLLLCYDFTSHNFDDIGIRSGLKLSVKETLSQLINLDINIFSNNVIDIIRKVQGGGVESDTSTNLDVVKKILYGLFEYYDETNNDIYIKYLNYSKNLLDDSDEKYYILFYFLIKIINNDNSEKLKSLINIDYINKNINKLDLTDDDGLGKLFKYNLITLSDIIENDTKGNFKSLKYYLSNYKLREILKENNFEKTKSYLEFIKENNLDISLSKSSHIMVDCLGAYDEINLKELDFEVIDLMLMNNQITFLQLSNIADDDMVIKTLKYIAKPGYESMLSCIKDTNLKQKVEIELFQKTNNFSANVDTFLSYYEKLDINKIIEDLNKSYGEKEDTSDIFMIIFIILTTDKKDEILNKVDKNVFNKINIEFNDGDLDLDLIKSEMRKHYPSLEKLITIENMKMSIDSVSKYLPEDKKKKLRIIFKFLYNTSERIVISFKSFSKRI
jgi:hypothetical protein